MDPTTYNPSFYQGDTWNIAVSLTKYTTSGTTEPYDLTGYTAKSQLRKHPYSTYVIIELDCDIPTPSGGQINITAPPSGTAIVPAGTYSWDLQIVSTSATYTVLKGQAAVTAEVTRT